MWCGWGRYLKISMCKWNVLHTSGHRGTIKKLRGGKVIEEAQHSIETFPHWHLKVPAKKKKLIGETSALNMRKCYSDVLALAPIEEPAKSCIFLAGIRSNYVLDASAALASGSERIRIRIRKRVSGRWRSVKGRAERRAGAGRPCLWRQFGGDTNEGQAGTNKDGWEERPQRWTSSATPKLCLRIKSINSWRFSRNDLLRRVLWISSKSKR